MPGNLGGWIGVAVGAVLSLCWLMTSTPLSRIDEIRIDSPWSLLIFLFITLFCLGLWWYGAPLPLVQDHRRANAEQEVAARDGKLVTAEGVFEMECLPSVRLSADGCLPGRYGLVITGDVVPVSALIGWPGLPQDVANEVRDALLARVPGGGEVLTGASS